MRALFVPSLFAFGVPGAQEWMIIFIIVAISAVCIWALVHCCLNKDLSDEERVTGILMIVLLGIIGATLYFFLARSRRKAALAKKMDEA